ncbi:MAG: hypothetical protein JO358_04340, partial [Alphaproteobacteria bacterium]|nr:hypothetical protein [Alphaproteobacteria bacterium]
PGRVLLVLAPRFGHVWRPGDAAYVRFLAHGIGSADARLVLVAADATAPVLPPGLEVDWWNSPSAEPPASAPPESLAGLIPDTPTRTLAGQTGLLGLAPEHRLDLPHGRLLVDPALRARPAAPLRRQFDKLGAIEGIEPSLRAYAQRHGNGYFCDPVFLITQSWERFAEGAYDIALDLAEHAVLCTSDPAARARFLYELQGMRIALQRFADARRVSDPDHAQPAAIRAGLLLAKGWALALSGCPGDAKPYLATAKSMLHASVGSVRQFLYVRNIYALSLARTGEWEQAMAEEKEIEAALDAHAVASGAPDWPLTYVNSLNQARLYKYRKDFSRALQYYDRAFATTLGARSESDAIYANLCLARLHAEAGEAQDAYFYWLRAGLHWAAARVPEALAPRVTSGILGRPIDRRDQVVDEISEVLIREIARAARVAGRDCAPVMETPVFRRLDGVAAAQGAGFERMIGDPGWAVLVACAGREPPALGSEPHVQLRRLLASLILSAVPDWESSRPARILLPCGTTGELPRTRAEATLITARLGIGDLVYGGRAYALSASERQRLIASRRIIRGEAVGAFGGNADESLTIEFKRYRAPVELTGLAARVFAAAAEARTPAELAALLPDAPLAQIGELVEELETMHLLQSIPSESAKSHDHM